MMNVKTLKKIQSDYSELEARFDSHLSEVFASGKNNITVYYGDVEKRACDAFYRTLKHKGYFALINIMSKMIEISWK